MRYFIGAQIDVSGLIEGGRGLESFETLLIEERSRDSPRPPEAGKKSLKKLKELSQMFCYEEGIAVQTHSRSNSLREDASSTHRSIRGAHDHSTRTPRRVLGEDRADDADSSTWRLSSLGSSGKLPGVYQNVSLSHPTLPHRSRRSCTTIDESTAVPPRAPRPLPPHHLRLPRPPHPRPPAIHTPRPRRRPSARPRRALRRPRRRRRRHRQDLLATSPPAPARSERRLLHPSPPGRSK